MTEALKSFIERNIQLIEDKNFDVLYMNAYMEYMEMSNRDKVKPTDISALTDILFQLFGKEPIFDNNLTYVPNYYLVANDRVSDVVIPEGIDFIGKSAYRNCRNLQTLSLPNTLSEIGTEAFKGCYRLGSIFYNGSKEEWRQVKLGMQCFGPAGLILQDKTVYCNDGEVQI